MTPDRTIHVVDDDPDFRASLVRLLRVMKYEVCEYENGRAFAEAAPMLSGGCALLDVCMPDVDGLRLQRDLSERQVAIPIIIITGHGDVPMAVQAMKAGAADFLQKPFGSEALRSSIEAALSRSAPRAAPSAEPAPPVPPPVPPDPLVPGVPAAEMAAFKARLDALTAREREVLEGIVAGHPTKMIAYRLGISARTVDVHRSRITEKLQVRGLPNLVRMALAAGVVPTP